MATEAEFKVIMIDESEHIYVPDRIIRNVPWNEDPEFYDWKNDPKGYLTRKHRFIMELRRYTRRTRRRFRKICEGFVN